MVKHIVMWNFKEEFNQEEIISHASRIKKELEALAEVISGIICIRVITQPIESSNRQIMLYSEFKDKKSLEGYIIHPEHKKAGEFVRSVVTERACFDWEE